MNIKEIKEYIQYTRVDEDNTTSKPSSWLTGDDAPAFLKDSASEDVPVYLSTTGLFLYSVFLPQRSIREDTLEDLLNWNFGPSGGYGYGESYEKGRNKPTPRVFPPIDEFRIEALNKAEPIFFLREFQGFTPASYLEINQKFAHISGIHWVQAKQAYCKLISDGEAEEIVYAQDDQDNTICVAQQTVLDFYMLLTKTVLIRFFEVMRYHDVMHAISGKQKSSEALDDEHELYFRKTTSYGEKDLLRATVLRGYQVIRNRRSYKELLNLIELKKKKEYVSFIAYDWKHKKVSECSCDPGKLGSYFVDSDLPFEISPVFFKPEVLSKYKQDPDKYNVKQRSIYCRGAWNLKTYDINEAGQIHTYLVYLGYLPYQEQLYWKSFNEPPKAGISKRAYTTDFKGEWDTSDNPLESLEAVLQKFPTTQFKEKPLAIWSLPGSKNRDPFSILHYVITESAKEWSDQILALAKIVIDGFQKKNMRLIAKSLNCDNPQLGSLKLLDACLHAHGLDSAVIGEVMKPLYELWDIRSSVSAHGGGKIPDADLKLDYRNRLADIHNSLKLLSELIQSGVFNDRT
jgi:hypothetical protein